MRHGLGSATQDDGVQWNLHQKTYLLKSLSWDDPFLEPRLIAGDVFMV